MDIRRYLKGGVVPYLIFGVLTTAVNVAVYHACFRELGVSNVASSCIAWAAAVSFAFVTNKPLVFGSHDWSLGTLGREAASFFVCRIGTGVAEIGMMYVLVDKLALDGTAMKLLTNFIVIVLNYVASKLFIFNRTDTRG